MDTEKLIKMITKEVMKRIQELGDISQEENNEAQRVLIVDSCESESYKSFNRVLEGKNYRIDSLDNVDKEIDNYESIILTEIDNRELANLAVGVQCGRKEQIVINSILKGKRVLLLDEGIEYRKYKDTANKVFYSLYQSYEKKLSNYGIELFKKSNIEQVLMGEKQYDSCCCGETYQQNQEKEVEDRSQSAKIKNVILDEHIESKQSSQMYDFTQKKLVAEADLRRVYRDGVRAIKIRKKTVLTPLVRDFIRINNIHVTKIE